ncbi:MAG: thiamine pyrophosphate-binding protein [Candidatus Binatia bacterium]
MRVADFVAEYLEQRGVSHVYEVIGGMITRLVDAIHRRGRIELISVHHEQAAAFAADAMGRLTGVPGVAMGTSGPGATNLLTGIGSCYFDSVPAVFITGQVNRSEQKGERPTRQLGFQETDIIAMVRPITKAAWQISDPESMPCMLQQAFEVATSGRPGPVLLDLPMDVQGAEISATPLAAPAAAAAWPAADRSLCDGVLHQLASAERPLILAGGGVRAAMATPLLRRFVDLAGVPLVNSLLAVDALPYRHPLRAGMIGTYGNRWTNLAIGRADLLLVLGSRLDIRQTGAQVAAFSAGRIICHVDVDEGEINNRLQGCQSIVSHLEPFLTGLAEAAATRRRPDRAAWIAEIRDLRAQWPDTAELTVPGINPNAFMHDLARASGQAGVFVADVGNHQMWAAQSLELEDHQKFITSGGMGAMGFGLPAAIGAAFATHQPVVLIAGDGGMQVNIQELQTVTHHRLPIKMVILDNESLGMVRQFQQSYFQERYVGTAWGYSAPDFAAVARAYKIESLTVSEPDSLRAAFERTWAMPGDPFLLHVKVDVSANAYPKIAFGRPMTEMEPFAKPVEMEGT